MKFRVIIDVYGVLSRRKDKYYNETKSFAIGTGSAYVIIMGMCSKIFKVYRYDVY